ncbi:sigma 54-interacting transcriptional regulator [Pendulispora albinea]|uniref:Sigma 54-interacting transcriptional regulator n=1 Tax=Pendulispora albinea TaxID=2741071 RepID=A0ABZ2LJF1_9BACT
MSDTNSVTVPALIGAQGNGPFLRIFTAAGSFDVGLGQGTWTVGRGRDADVHIEDPSVSRAHARLHIGEQTWVEDLGSANGTKAGGRLLEPKKRVLVTDGTPLEFGEALGVLRMTHERSPTLGATQEHELSADGSDMDRILLRVARADLPVLIEGETGSGKDHTAQRIHTCSKRFAGPMVRVSCAQVRSGQVDLADCFARAASGSLLLDDVADLGAEGQALLLRAWEHVLERSLPKVAARVLSMSSGQLEQAVTAGAFRGDLFYRLAHLTLRIPPLRARTSEFADLATSILDDVARARHKPPPLLSADALRVLERHTWPGNLRELRAVLERALVLANPRVLTASHFEELEARNTAQQKARISGPPAEPLPSFGSAPPAASGDSDTGTTNQSLREAAESAEYQRILEALRACNGNQTRAAKLLGISRGTLITRLERYNVPRPRKL